MKEILALRKEIKSRKPNFLRQDGHKLNKLAKKWIAPKGQHSKTRKKLRGYRKHPGVGYSSPKKVRGLSKEGFKQIVVHNLKELQEVKDACIISSTIGTKNKITLLKKAKELKIKVLNIKNIDDFMKKVEDSLKARKKKVELKKEKKKKSKEQSLKKAKEKEEKEKKKTEEDKEKEEKKIKEEKRKVLEKK